MNRKVRIGKKQYEIVVLVGLCLLCNSYKLIFSCFWAEPGLQTPQDVFSTLYSAAYFAGKDWSVIGKEYSAYYGYGFVTLFSWLYKITNDGLFVYRFILLFCNLLTAISCVICYKIADSFNFIKSRKVLYFLCIACTSVQGTGNWGINNEYALNVCTWIILYLLVKLCEPSIQKKQKIKYTLILGIFLIYSCTVHARAVANYMLVIFCIVIIGIVGKRIIVNIPLFVGTFFLYIPYKYFTNRLQIELLGEINSNSSVIAKLSNGVGGGFSWKMVGTFIISIITYFHELSVITAGISIICVAIVLHSTYCFFKRKLFVNIDEGKRNGILCLLIYSVCGIGGFLVSTCFSVRQEIHRGITTQTGFYLRFLTLVRYFMPYVAPMVFTTLVLLMYWDNKKRKEVLIISMVVLVMCQLVFLFYVFPSIKFTGWSNAIYLPYTWDIEMDRENIYLVGGVLLLFNLSFFNLWLFRKKNWIGICIVLLVFAVGGNVYRYTHQVRTIKQFELVDGGYAYLCREKNPKTIYIVEELEAEEDDESVLTTYYFLYQLLLPNMRIVPGEPPKGSEDILILSNNPAVIENYENYEIIQLDNNEWLLR